MTRGVDLRVLADLCSVLSRDGSGCDRPVAAESPVRVCSHHLVVIYDVVAGSVGETDVLPYPCTACGCRIGVHYPSGWLCAECEWPLGAVASGVDEPPRVEVVYYLRFDDRVKIGTSAGPRRRIAQLPHDEVLAFERGGRLLEARRHDQFAASRIPRTEWFESSADLGEHIAALREGVDDPWRLYDHWVARARARTSL